METIIRVQVVITSVNKAGKTDIAVCKTNSILGATRVMITFKPKRGYWPVKYVVEEVEELL